MPDYGAILTRAGRSALINAEVGDALVSLTHFAVGDGVITLNEDLTALVAERHRVAIASIQRDPDDETIFQIDATIPANIGGFTIREVGVFDANGRLFALGLVPDTIKPSITDGATKDVALRMSVRLANEQAENLSLEINPFVSAASTALTQRRMPTFPNGKRVYNIGAFPVQSNGVRTEDVTWTGDPALLPQLMGAQNSEVTDNGDGTVSVTFRGRANGKVQTYTPGTDTAGPPTGGVTPFNVNLNNAPLGLANRIADDADGLDRVNLAIIGQGGQQLHRYDKDDADPALWNRVTDEAPKALAAWGETAFDCLYVSIGESHATGGYGETLNSSGAIATHEGRIALADKVLRDLLALPYVRDDAQIIIQLHYTSATRRSEMNFAWEALANRRANLHLAHSFDTVSVDDLHFANAHDLGYYTVGEVWRGAQAAGDTRFMPMAVRHALGPEGLLLPVHRTVELAGEQAHTIGRDYLNGHVFQTNAAILTLPQIINGHDGSADIFIHNISTGGVNPGGTSGTIIRAHPGQKIRIPKSLTEVTEIKLDGLDIIWLKWINNRWRTLVWESRPRERITNFATPFQWRLKPEPDGDYFSWFGKTGDLDPGESVNVVYPTRFEWAGQSQAPEVETTWRGYLTLGAGFHNQPDITVTDVNSIGFTVTNTSTTETFLSADFTAFGLLESDPFA